MTYHTVIIGGGLAGLSAAVLLANAGKKVAVYEQSKHWGGRALTHEKDRFYFNLGPRGLYRAGSAFKLMESLGITLQGKLPTLNHHAKALYQGDLYTYTTTPRAMLTTKLMTVGEKVKLAHAFVKLFRADCDALHNMSWQTWLDTIPNVVVRAQLAAAGRLTTYAHDPINTSAGATIAQIRAGVTTNVLYLDDGWQQLIDALLAQAKAKGVALFLGEGAKGIDARDSGFAITVGREGARVTAENVIIATPPSAAAKLLPQSAHLKNAITKLNPMKTACLTLALNDLPNPNCVFALGIDQSFYYSLHSASANVAPQGRHLAYLMTYLSSDHRSDPAEDRAMLEANFDRLQPGWRDHVVHAEYLPRIMASYGAVTAAPSRPNPPLPDCPNVYIVGDWVGQKQWLADASVHSAEVAVNAILAR